MAGVPVDLGGTVALAIGTDDGVRPYTWLRLRWSRTTRPSDPMKLIQSCLVVRCWLG